MMNDEDIKEYHDLNKLKTYQPLPSGLTIADSRISGQGVFTTRRLVAGTELGISHYRIDKTLIGTHGKDKILFRTPLGGFINHADEPNCVRNQIRIKPGFDKWNLAVIKDIEEGEELTLKYTMYDPKK